MIVPPSQLHNRHVENRDWAHLREFSTSGLMQCCPFIATTICWCIGSMPREKRTMTLARTCRGDASWHRNACTKRQLVIPRHCCRGQNEAIRMIFFNVRCARMPSLHGASFVPGKNQGTLHPIRDNMSAVTTAQQTLEDCVKCSAVFTKFGDTRTLEEPPSRNSFKREDCQPGQERSRRFQEKFLPELTECCWSSRSENAPSSGGVMNLHTGDTGILFRSTFNARRISRGDG